MATREQLIEDFADHKYATGEKFARLINSMKVVQEPVADPAALGTSLSFIDSIEQDKDGKITATKKTLDLSNAHELNPFKGWWKTGDTLPTSGFDGAYLYFKDTTQTPAVTTIYRWNGTAYADTGTVVDTSNVQTFCSGQQVNEVKIKDENGEEVQGSADVFSAEAGKNINSRMLQNKLVGNNNEVSHVSIYGLQPNTRYRLYLPKQDWRMDGVTVTDVYRFFLYCYNGTTPTTLKYYRIGSTPDSYFDFTTPNTFDYIKVGVRASRGENVYFSIVIQQNIDVIQQKIDVIQQKIDVIGINSVVGTKFSSLSYNNGYISYNNNNKKKFVDTSIVKYAELPIDSLSTKVSLENITTFTPSPGAATTYARIIFFDEEDNLLTFVDTLTDKTSMTIDVPNGAASCYVDVPTNYIDEVTVRTHSIDNLLTLIVGTKFSSLSYKNGYISYDNNHKKKLFGAPQVKYAELPIDSLSTKVSLENITSFTPSPGAATTYARIIFFDEEDNLLTFVDTLTDKTSMTIDVPNGAASCYVDVPTNYIDEVTVRTHSIDNELEIDKDIFYRNLDKIPMLTASCRYRKSSETSKDFQLLIVTDSHGDNVAVENSIKAANEFDKIDALIHCGDCVSNYAEVNSDQSAIWKNLVSKCRKPFYFVMGNHEKGTYPQILGHPYEADLYRDFIKPSVDAGYLVSGEYTVDKCYYYHDFASAKIRLIVLDEYEAPYIIDDTIWEPIDYDSSLSNYVIGSSYTTGDKVNVPNYTEHSFQAKSNVTIDVYYGTKVPCYKHCRGYRWISQTQAQWFLDTLAATPSEYQVIVACHNPFSPNTTSQANFKFCQNGTRSGSSDIQSYMANDFIADAINAFQNKESFSTICSSQYPADMPPYNVSKDFTGVNATFHSFIGGHSHKDLIWKHNTYLQYQVAPVCANANNNVQARNADIRRSNSSTRNTIDVDCLTAVSFGAGRLGLVKIGVNVTEDGYKRDFEVIDITQ